MKYFSLNRFEDKIAILEDDGQKIHKVKKSLLPRGVREGDMFFKEKGRFVFDKNETLIRRKKNAEMLKDIYD